MARQRIKPKIFNKLKKKFPDRTDNAISVKLSKLSRKHNVTLNAASEIWGRQENFSTWGLLEQEDKDSLKDKTFQPILIKKEETKSRRKSVIEFIQYSSNDKLVSAHIDEINKCYTHACYTASFILVRKVLENLIVQIAKKLFPGKSKQHKEIYLDLNKGRIHDLSILIKNLRGAINGLDPDEKKLLQRIMQLSEQFKNDANDKTHLLYHMSTKRELEEKNPQMIFDLIGKYFDEH